MKIENILACPACRQPSLVENPSEYNCASCGAAYSIRDGVPVLLRENSEIVHEDTKRAEFWDAGWESRNASLLSSHRDEILRARAEYVDYLTKEGYPSVTDVIPDHVRGKLFLNIGCGGGYEGLLFSGYGVRYIGVDFSHNAARYTRDIVAKAEFEGVTYQAEAEALPFRDESIEYIYSSGVLHHTPNIEETLKEVYRVLAPGGTAMIGVYASYSIMFVWYRLHAVLRGNFTKKSIERWMHANTEGEWQTDKRKNHWTTTYNKPEFSEMMHIAGFSGVHIQQTPLQLRAIPVLGKILSAVFPAKVGDMRVGPFGGMIVATCIKTVTPPDRMRFLSNFGLLPGTWTNLVLILIAGVSEGFGITLFIPLLYIMGGGDQSELPRPFSEMQSFLEGFQIEFTPMILLGLIVIFSLAALAIGYIQRKMLIKTKRHFTRNLQNTLFKEILRTSWAYSSKRSNGEIVNQLMVECSRAGNSLGFELMAVAFMLQIAVYLAFSFTVSWQLTVTAGIFGVVMYLAVRPLFRQAKSLGAQSVEVNKDFSFISLEYIRNLKLLKATANEAPAIEGISNRTDRLYKMSVDLELNGAQLYFLVQALPVLMLAVIIAISNEVLQIRINIVLVFLLFMVRIAPKVGQLQQQIQSFHHLSPAMLIVREMIDACRENHEIFNHDGRKFDRIKDQISLENLTFKYSEDGVPAVKNVSMEFRKNKTVAIVGSSGAGKSTIMDILTGLRIPQHGQMSIDGFSLGEYDLNSWRRRIGLVTQETAIFNSSMRENLKFYCPKATEENISKALSLAHLDKVVADLPDGLETILGENGAQLSGGQKQRLALARALVGDPEILLLDEATSALDNESEHYVQQGINTIAHRLTIVVIAHRLSTVRHADYVYVMENGCVVESGTYEHLSKNSGRFADLQKLELI